MQIEQQRIPVGDIQLNVRSAGTGPTVLLLHGFPDSGEMWNEVTQLLAATGYRVLAPDLRGFGESDAPLGRRHYTLDRVVADLIAILDRLSPGEPVRVAGHDWGAVVAWCLSLAHPERVLSNVVISVGHPREYAVAGLEQKRKGLYTIAWQARGLAEAWLSRGDFAGLRGWVRQHPRLEDCVRSMSRPGRLTAGLNWYRANLMRVMLGTWPPCTVPTLGLWSSGDHFLAEDQMQRSQRRMTAPWEYVRIDGAGHWLPLEQPAGVAGLCADWFRKHEARPRGK